MHSEDSEFFLIEVSKDEKEYIERMRVEFGVIEKGVTYSEKPRNLEMKIETENTVVKVKHRRKDFDIKTYKKERNPNKISHWIYENQGNRLEFYSYSNTSSERWFVSLNGAFITLRKHDWRHLCSVQSKIGHLLGLFGNKKQKNRRKK